MSQKQISQWRTVGVVVFACVLILVAFLVTIIQAAPKDAPLPLDNVDRLYSALVDGIVWLVAAVALKASIQHLAGGGGVKGALKALTTDAQPGDPQEPPKPPEGQP